MEVEYQVLEECLTSTLQKFLNVNEGIIIKPNQTEKDYIFWLDEDNTVYATMYDKEDIKDFQHSDLVTVK